jgi:hypothetical protein
MLIEATFFSRFGFSASDWPAFASALRQHAIDHEVSKVEDSPFGMRYVIEGAIVTPDKRNPIAPDSLHPADTCTCLQVQVFVVIPRTLRSAWLPQAHCPGARKTAG